MLERIELPAKASSTLALSEAGHRPGVQPSERAARIR